MTEMACFYPVEKMEKLNMDGLYKRLHADGQGEEDRRIRERASVLWEEAKGKMNLSACYRMGGHAFSTGIAAADACQMQIVCLVYVSDGGENVIGREEEPDILDMYLLDVIGSEMLFRASEQLNAYLWRTFCEKGLFLTAPYFPGDDGIPLEVQKGLLEIIKQEEEVEVEIGSGMMLTPEKALLYVFGADRNNKRYVRGHHCRQCGRKDCSFRKNVGE